jgi:hypothetical protein
MMLISLCGTQKAVSFVNETMIHHRHKITPYPGEKLFGVGEGKHGLPEKRFMIMVTSAI